MQCSQVAPMLPLLMLSVVGWPRKPVHSGRLESLQT